MESMHVIANLIYAIHSQNGKGVRFGFPSSNVLRWLHKNRANLNLFTSRIGTACALRNGPPAYKVGTPLGAWTSLRAREQMPPKTHPPSRKTDILPYLRPDANEAERREYHAKNDKVIIDYVSEFQKKRMLNSSYCNMCCTD